MAPSRPIPRLGHQPAFDGLRGVGCLLVMAFHGDGLLPGGYLGVDLFFVLSGFLITTLLLEEAAAGGRIDLGRFYRRRFRRLFPAQAAFVLASTAAVQLLGPAEDPTLRELSWVTWPEAGATLLSASNWLMARGAPGFGVLRHLWSLCVEAHFYLAWPLALRGLLARGWGPRRIAALLALAVLAAAALRALLYGEGGPAGFARAYYASDARADGLLMGGLFAALRAGGFTLPRWARRLSGAGAVALLGYLVAAAPREAPFLYRGALTALALAVALLLTGLSAPSPGRGLLRRALELRPLAWVGKISYSLYLWHVAAFLLGSAAYRTVLGGSFALSSLLSVALAFGLASASYYLIEKPLLSSRSPGHDPRPAPA